MIAQAISAWPEASVRDALYVTWPLLVVPRLIVKKAWAMSFQPASHSMRLPWIVSWALSTRAFLVSRL